MTLTLAKQTEPASGRKAPAGRLFVLELSVGPGDRMFVTDFAGSLYSARLDGSGERNFLYAQGNLTGIAYTEI
jgi:hypothetical protein